MHSKNDIVNSCSTIFALQNLSNVTVTAIVIVLFYCEIILFRGQTVLWIDDKGHVCGHLNSGISNYFNITNYTNKNKRFVGFLNSWNALPTKYTKLNVQQM